MSNITLVSQLFFGKDCLLHFVFFVLQDHVKGKPHKRRLHALETEPYTIEESERAAGMGSYRQPQKRKMETMIPKAIEEYQVSDNDNCTGTKRAKTEMKE